MSPFKLFEDTSVLYVCILSLLFAGFCFGVMLGAGDELLQSIGSLGGFFSGLGTCLAVAIAWGAKQDWIHQRNFDVQDRMIKKTFKLYTLGVESYSFCICLLAHSERIDSEDIPTYIDKTEKIIRSFVSYMILCVLIAL